MGKMVTIDKDHCVVLIAEIERLREAAKEPAVPQSGPFMHTDAPDGED